MAGWRTVAIESPSRKQQETSSAPIQSKLREELWQIDFIWVSFSDADKSDGSRRPPGGEGELAPRNGIEESTLRELAMHHARAGKTGREGPADSAHWGTSRELAMSEKGAWKDKNYDACTLQGARRRRQRIRHDV